MPRASRLSACTTPHFRLPSAVVRRFSTPALSHLADAEDAGADAAVHRLDGLGQLRTFLVEHRAGPALQVGAEPPVQPPLRGASSVSNRFSRFQKAMKCRDRHGAIPVGPEGCASGRSPAP
jgi:hypothetical protein